MFIAFVGSTSRAGICVAWLKLTTLGRRIVKSVQSTLNHLQSPPEWMQSQRNYSSFLSKSNLHGTIVHSMLAQNCPKGKRQWLNQSNFSSVQFSSVNVFHHIHIHTENYHLQSYVIKYNTQINTHITWLSYYTETKLQFYSLIVNE